MTSIRLIHVNGSGMWAQHRPERMAPDSRSCFARPILDSGPWSSCIRLPLDHSERSARQGFLPRPRGVRDGAAFSETDEGIDYATLIKDLLAGQYNQALRVVAFNPVEGWSRDASEDVARDVEQYIAARSHDVSRGLRGFVESHLGRAIGAQLSLPLQLAGHG
ncbi:hypothetical protein [Bradyrhizobium sp. CCBAU 11434]|uniref:hypothetical protein n=1 Tax=Bradyrhizobium sp. CCBAU 11434 TaxID=1630885 RepID=UPI00230646D8|nr:hypothetical protein [Bradyrhizobium sp. CCBAU 11434]